VTGTASEGEVLVSSTVKEPAVGSAAEVTDRGEHGMVRAWRRFAVAGRRRSDP